MEQRSDGLVRITLKKAYTDGTIAVDMDPLSPLCRVGRIRGGAAALGGALAAHRGPFHLATGLPRHRRRVRPHQEIRIGLIQRMATRFARPSRWWYFSLMNACSCIDSPAIHHTCQPGGLYAPRRHRVVLSRITDHCRAGAEPRVSGRVPGPPGEGGRDVSGGASNSPTGGSIPPIASGVGGLRASALSLEQLESLADEPAAARAIVAPSALGSLASDLVFTPVPPCRVIDTPSGRRPAGPVCVAAVLHHRHLRVRGPGRPNQRLRRPAR